MVDPLLAVIPVPVTAPNRYAEPIKPLRGAGPIFTTFLLVARSYSHSTHSLAVDDDASLASRRKGLFGAADAAAGVRLFARGIARKNQTVALANSFMPGGSDVRKR